MKKTSAKIIIALFFVICLTIQLGIGIFAARDAVGDLDGNGSINKDDAIHLLGNTIFSDLYPVDQPCDYNKDGTVDKDDAIYLLGHTLFSDIYYICQHEGDKWDISEVVEPTCKEKGYTVIVCECGETDKVDYTPVSADAHVWEVKDDTHAATCMTNGYIVNVCTVCGVEETVDDLAEGHEYEEPACGEEAECLTCGAVIAARGHVFGEFPEESHDANCTEAGYDVFKCENCDFTYEVTTEPAEGHSVSDNAWTLVGKTPVEGKECIYVWVEKAACEACGENIERLSDEFVYHIENVTVIEATCAEKGTKTVSCKVCSEVISETDIPVNEEAHVWVEKAAVNNTVEYACDICSATKKTVSATENDALDVGAVDEIVVNDVSIVPDASTSEQLSGGSVYVSVEIHDAADIDNISEEIAERISDDPIYDLSIQDESREEITNFDGWITVTVPYALEEGEDPDHIVVWYIDENGEITAIEGVEYRDGFAIFKTNHFSKYLVTRMTVEEICEAFGHSHKELYVPATCVIGGYSGVRCQRCADEEITERTEALGHNWEVTSSTELTCEVSGETVYTCSRCYNTYNETVAAMGHDYKAEEDCGITDRYKAPTCSEAGEHYIVCTKCDAEYKEELPTTEHDDEIAIVLPECETSGYTEYVCKICENVRKKDITLPTGHDYKDGKCRKCEKYCEHDYYYGECNICGMSKKAETPDVPVEPDVPHDHVFQLVTVDAGCEAHKISYYLCECGKAKNLDFDGDTFLWQFTGDYEGSYYCTECDIVLTAYYRESSLPNCSAYVEDKMTLFNGEEVIVHFEEEYYTESHQMYFYVELKEGAETCLDGVIVTVKCRVCGEVDSVGEKNTHFVGDTPIEYGCYKHKMVYGACACGEVKEYFDCDYDSFSLEVEGDLKVFTCPGCDVRIEQVEFVGERNDDCQAPVSGYWNVSLGENEEFRVDYEHYQYFHNWFTTVALKEGAATCLDGVIVTRKCTDCGTEITFANRYHYSPSNKIPGACEEHNLTYGECACGENGGVYFDNETFAYANVNGKRIYSCDKCGVRVERHSTESAKDEQCRVDITWYYKASMGDEVVAEITYTSQGIRHNSVVLSVELMEGSVTCLDGVKITEKCNDCGETLNYESKYHERVLSTVPGACEEHNLTYGACACGENGGVYFDYSTFDESYNDKNQSNILSCAKCNIIIEQKYTETEPDENCNAYYTEFYVLTHNGEVIFEINTEGDTVSHRYSITSAELIDGAETCLDGVLTTMICKTCGDTRVREVYYHARIDSAVDGVCADHSLTFGECACGAEGRASFNRSTFQLSSDGNKSVYTCEKCGVKIDYFQIIGEKGENCQVTIEEHYSLYLNGELKQEIDFTGNGTRHNTKVTSAVLKEGAQSCLDGVIITTTCSDCGYTRTREAYYHEYMETKVTLGCDDHNVSYGRCACGENGGLFYNSSTFVSSNENGKRIYTCETCDMRIVRYSSVTDLPGCQYTEKSYRDLYYGDDLLHEDVSVYTFENHNIKSKEFSDECSDVTNADGTRTVINVVEMYCTECLASIEKVYTTTYYSADGVAEREEVKYYDYVSVDGTVTETVLYRETSEEFVFVSIDARDKPVRLTTCFINKEYKNDVVSYWSESKYTYDEDNLCLVTHEFKGSNGNNYTETRTNHLYIDNKYVLSNGSESCLDGIDRVRFCAVCGEEIERVEKWGSYHRASVTKETVDLRDHGALCDVTVEIMACPCGAEMYISYSDNADFETSWRYDKNHEYRIYSCAVSDPEKCGFVWVWDKYSTVDDQCNSTSHNDFYFGVDIATKDNRYKTLFATSDGRKQHIETVEVERTETTETFTVTCERCGQLIRTDETVRDGVLLTSTIKEYDNRTGEYVSKVDKSIFHIVPGSDRNAVLSERVEELDADGNVTFWKNYEYSYPNADSGNYCYYNRVYTTSNGINTTTSREDHLGYREYQIYYNCVESREIIHCSCCGYEDIGTYGVWGHSFIYDGDKGTYVCQSCGQESDTGVNGEVAFVDVSYEGDGTKHIVNYRNSSNYEYLWNIKLGGEGVDPVLLDESFYTDAKDEYRLYIDAAAVAEKAAELGLGACEYYFEINFVPTSANNTLVYTVVLNPHIYLVDEANCIIPEYGCYGEGGVTIAKVCALCDASITENYNYHDHRQIDVDIEKTADENGNTLFSVVSTFRCKHCGDSYTYVTTTVYSELGLLIREKRDKGLYSESFEYDYENGIRSFIRENFEIIDGVKVRTEFYINKFRMSDDKIVYSHNEHKGYVTTEEFDYDADVRTWTKSITYYYGDTESVETQIRKFRISDNAALYYKLEVDGVVVEMCEWELSEQDGIRTSIGVHEYYTDGVLTLTEITTQKHRISDNQIIYTKTEREGYSYSEELDFDAGVRQTIRVTTYDNGDGTTMVETTTCKSRISDGLDLYYKYEVNGVVRNTREWIFSDEGDIRTTVCVTTKYDNGEASYTQTNTSKMNIADGWIISEAYSDSNGSFWECEYLRYEGNNYTKLYKCVEYTEVRDHNFAEDTVTITKTHNDETGSVETWTERISTGEIIG